MADDQEVATTAPELISSVASLPPSADVPQFSTAEYAHIPGTERCRVCGYPVTGEYFRINGQMACAKCAAQARDGQPENSHAAFLRALLLGAGAAVVGLILYASFTILTDLYIGFIALGVGWLVGKAMMRGSNGMGKALPGRGRAADLLRHLGGRDPHLDRFFAEAPHTAYSPDPADRRLGNRCSRRRRQHSGSGLGPRRPPKTKPTLLKTFVQLLFIGLASPFLELRDPVHGLIGLVILFVGLRIAYSMTAAKPLEVEGPYPITA